LLSLPLFHTTTTTCDTIPACTIVAYHYTIVRSVYSRMPASKAVSVVEVSDDPQKYEDEHVHSVYDEIAPHFSSTRYKPWPIIAHFLSSLPTGWIGLDSGTGNGKYLPLPLDRPGEIWTIGMDRSRNLLEIAQTAGGVHREVVWGNILDKPWRDGAFDFAISIATIHHLSTHARRKLAVQRLLQCISPSHGRALIYVWAIEQDGLSKRKIPSAESASLRENDSQGQDVFVPWVLSAQQTPKPTQMAVTENESKQTAKVYNRYYHMFARGELAELVREGSAELGLEIGASPAAGDRPGRRGIEIVQDGWERSNYYIELRRWKTDGRTCNEAV